MSAKLITLRGGILLVVAALATGTVLYTSDSPDREKATRRPTPEPEYPRLTRTMQRFREASATLDWDYQDEKVSAREWLQRSNEQLPKMVSAASHLYMRFSGTISDRHAADLRQFARLAQIELEALFDLRGAIADRDAVRETYAWDQWAQAVDRMHHFLSGYYVRRGGMAPDFAGLSPSITLKSLA